MEPRAPMNEDYVSQENKRIKNQIKELNRTLKNDAESFADHFASAFSSADTRYQENYQRISQKHGDLIELAASHGYSDLVDPLLPVDPVESFVFGDVHITIKRNILPPAAARFPTSSSVPTPHAPLPPPAGPQEQDSIPPKHQYGNRDLDITLPKRKSNKGIFHQDPVGVSFVEDRGLFVNSYVPRPQHKSFAYKGLVYWVVSCDWQDCNGYPLLSYDPQTEEGKSRMVSHFARHHGRTILPWMQETKQLRHHLGRVIREAVGEEGRVNPEWMRRHNEKLRQRLEIDNNHREKSSSRSSLNGTSALSSTQVVAPQVALSREKNSAPTVTQVRQQVGHQSQVPTHSIETERGSQKRSFSANGGSTKVSKMQREQEEEDDTESGTEGEECYEPTPISKRLRSATPGPGIYTEHRSRTTKPASRRHESPAPEPEPEPEPCQTPESSGQSSLSSVRSSPDYIP